MKLTLSQIRQYHENGYLLIKEVFSQQEVDLMLKEMKNIISEDCPRRILEKNGQVRSFFAPEWNSRVFQSVIRLKRLITPASQLIGNSVYVHQTKLNSKYAMLGDWWEWHQDYTFWKNEDGMPTPKVLTAMIFLNEITEFNGPLLLIPGSHRENNIDMERNQDCHENADGWFSDYRKSADYMSALTTDLKYTLKQNTILKNAEKKGIHSAKGPSGSVLFFHGNIFHASSNNLSPWDRHTFLITYNSTDNILPEMQSPRPEFIANRNFSPIEPDSSEMLSV